MQITHEPLATKSHPNIEARRVVAVYAELDRQIKALESQREQLKATAVESLRALGGSASLDQLTATLSEPEECDVDLTVLQAHVSVRKFRELTRRSPIIDKIRAHLTAGTFSSEARRAISFRTGTPRIVITRKAS